MARIAGINIPQNKVVSIALTYIHGIGLHSSKKICKKLDIPSSKRVNELTEEQVLKKVLEKYELRDCEKFIQEIYWRTYWKGWLEHRPSVYSDYLEDRNKLIEQFSNKKFYLNAISGNTNLSFFNNWINIVYFLPIGFFIHSLKSNS